MPSNFSFYTSLNRDSVDLTVSMRSYPSDPPYDRHVWLECDGMIIDITADQFPNIKSAIIVARDSEWHRGLFVDKRMPVGVDGEDEQTFYERILADEVVGQTYRALLGYMAGT